ncbi:MAG: hypothetical protein HOP11_13260 [Saprospiraceae bacterium]|nr:hypothetical protein [Saprospiraceae bacterium]
MNKNIKVRKNLREQISRDLHDHLGSTLSTIALVGDAGQSSSMDKMKSDLRFISEEARELTTILKDFVWVLKDNDADSQELISRMNSFGNTILEAKNIQSIFKFEPKICNITFSMEQRKNIYFLFKEIINNVAKHSKASNVFIDLILNKGELVIEITDNGVGFDISNSSNGSGIRNIRERCSLLKAKLSINSVMNEGSSFKISIPIK